MKTRRKSVPHSRVQKYQDVGRTIRERIDAGRYDVGDRLPTEVELARDLNVNPLTVSRALRDLVREGRIVRRRGDGTYVSDGTHRPLVEGRHIRIGVLWRNSVVPSRLHDSFFGRITCGALDAWKLAAAPRWPGTTEQEPTRAIWSDSMRRATVEVLGEAMPRADRHPPLEDVRAAHYDGLICVGIIQEDYIQALLGLGLPTVLVDFPNDCFADRADQVFADPGPGYRAAVRHFVEKGFKRIHFVGCLAGLRPGMTGQFEWRGWPLRVDPDSFLRLGAYRMAMNEVGLPLRDDWAHYAWFDQDFNAALADRLAALPETDRPQALVCHSRTHAEELMQLCAQRGLVLEAVGAEDRAQPGQSLAIRVNAAAMGAAAAQLLVWRLNTPDRPMLRVGVAANFEPAQRAAHL